MAGDITLTYSRSDQGWPSRYSFYPDMIKGMNNYMYTFRGGKLYRHNTNSLHNNFYGEQHSSSITSAFNESPLEVKLFKTIELESNKAWSANLETDLNKGIVEHSYFEEKEGTFFSHIRSNEDTPDFNLRSTIGLGVSTIVTGSPSARTIYFSHEITSMLSLGDSIYATSNPVLVGNCTAIDRVNNFITVDASAGTQPNVGDIIIAVKDQVAESLGMRGYYNQFTLTNSDTTPVELFSVGTDVFKSYP